MKPISKYCLQDAQYEFPYHYLPSLDKDDVLRLHRHLTWGLDYITYMTFVGDLIRECEPQSLLDVGCGDGRLIHMVKVLVPHVCGVDLSERAIRFARAFNPGVDFVCADVITISEQYACLTLVEVLEHIADADIADFLEHLRRLIQPDGWLLLSVPTVNVPLNNKHHRHYDLDLLKTTIAPHFEVERHWWLYRRGMLERLLRSLLCNRLYVLNSTPLLTAIWRLHKRWTYYGDAAKASHLVCLAKPKEH